MKLIKSDFRSKACVSPPGLTYGQGSKGQNSTLSEHGHVAYQINGNHKYSSMIANILLADPYPPTVPDPGFGAKRLKFNFFRTWSCCILNKGNHETQQHCSNILHADPLPPSSDRGKGSTGQNSTLSEQCHVAYQIKGNHECSNMIADIFPADPSTPPPPPKGSTGQIQLFQNMVMLHIKLKGITKCSNMIAKILPADPLPPLTLGKSP